MGTDLGLDEAARAALLLGGAAAIVARASTTADARALLDRERPAVLICSADDDETAELGAEATRRGVILLNARATDDALRNARCARLAFHVAASDAMRADAKHLWSARQGAGSAPTADDPELWDARLEKFGAAQLNARFQSRFNRPMDSDAWAGWFAVKVAWESSQRARSVEPAAMAAYLERETTQFDGQKGVPLSFRRWDHQLRQPLYVSAAASSGLTQSERESEPMPIPAPDAAPARTALDALGTGEETSSCRWP